MDESVDYCRAVEAYLCQKNGGHLVRIVGPAFEKVRGWAAQGVPLKVAFRGIDRCCERAARRGGRRRPMRIEFCEADVLDAFDNWRRAIGATATQVSETGEPSGEWAAATPRKGSLAAHIQRCVSRLLAPKGSAADAAYDEAVAVVTRELDELATRARQARGDSRAAIIERLKELDRLLLAAARNGVDAQAASALQAEADGELAGLAARMPPEALARARQLAFERLLREVRNLPVLSYE
jgi:hypothetical protein